MENLKHCNLIPFEDIYRKYIVESFFIMLYNIALKLQKLHFSLFFKWICMENDTFTRLYLHHFISPYKENTTTVSIRLISTAIAEKTSRKTFQDIWLYNFEITRRWVTILKCEVILFRHVQRYEHQTSYPGSALLPLRNEPVWQICETGNIFQDISSKCSKRKMQYHEHCRSRERERKNKHSN